MIEKGLNTQEKFLFVLDGGKGLQKAVKDVFGKVRKSHGSVFVNIFPDQSPPSRLAFMLGLPFRVVLGFSLFRFFV